MQASLGGGVWGSSQLMSLFLDHFRPQREAATFTAGRVLTLESN
jgi:hypothetical protein